MGEMSFEFLQTSISARLQVASLQAQHLGGSGRRIVMTSRHSVLFSGYKTNFSHTMTHCHRTNKTINKRTDNTLIPQTLILQFPHVQPRPITGLYAQVCPDFGPAFASLLYSVVPWP